jgi:ketosteroid isomerase-like protein
MAGLLAGRLPAQAAPTEADSSFRAFLVAFDSGLVAFVNGDPARWMANVSQADDATLLTPYGENLRGWAEVEKQYERVGRQFAPGSTVRQEYLVIEVQGDLGYTVVLQPGIYRSPDSDTSRAGFTRATNIFRREAGQWKLVHRHMDHLKGKQGE